MKLSLLPKLVENSDKRKERMKLSLLPKLVENSGKRKDRMKLSLLPKLVENLVWVPVISISKILIPSLHDWCPIMPKLVVLSLPNRGTSWIITLLCVQITSKIRYETRRAYGFKWICEYIITWKFLVIILLHISSTFNSQFFF
jgi:hypothetical protein